MNELLVLRVSLQENNHYNQSEKEVSIWYWLETNNKEIDDLSNNIMINKKRKPKKTI
jgi:hypothetical protein